MTPPRDNALSYQTPHRPLDGSDGVVLLISFSPIILLGLGLVIYLHFFVRRK